MCKTPSEIEKQIVKTSLLPRKDKYDPILFNVRKHCKSQGTYYIICEFLVMYQRACQIFVQYALCTFQKPG